MELKIKPIFLGKNVFKKNQIIDNTFCLYFNNGQNFVFAKKNKTFLESLLNTKNTDEKQIIVRVLNSEKFYEFLSGVSNLNNYSNFLKNHNLRFPEINYINNNFQNWLIGNTHQKQKATENISKSFKKEITKYITELKTVKLRELKRTEPKKKKLRRIVSKAK